VHKILAAAAVLVLGSGVATAGRRHLPWSQSTETLPERGFEVESWVSDEIGVGDADVDITRLGWAVTAGVTDQLELRLPAEVVWSRAAADPAAKTSIDRFGAELRYRLVTNDPVDAPAFAPLVRLAVLHQANERKAVRVEGDLAATYTAGGVMALADLGIVATIRRGEDRFQLTPSGGVAVLVGHDVRLGVEVRAQLDLRGEGDDDWVAVGPTLAWTHGRGWLALGAGIGIAGTIAAPRLAWGVAF
jgi:hypothetical protein